MLFPLVPPALAVTVITVPLEVAVTPVAPLLLIAVVILAANWAALTAAAPDQYAKFNPEVVPFVPKVLLIVVKLVAPLVVKANPVDPGFIAVMLMVEPMEDAETKLLPEALPHSHVVLLSTPPLVIAPSRFVATVAVVSPERARARMLQACTPAGMAMVAVFLKV
jgi:hypothetical protein